MFEENGMAYYSMEYIDGLSLSDAVKKRGKLSGDKNGCLCHLYAYKERLCLRCLLFANMKNA